MVNLGQQTGRQSNSIYSGTFWPWMQTNIISDIGGYSYEPGSISLYRKMSKHPTISLAKGVLTSPVLTLKWSVAKLREDLDSGMQSQNSGSGSGQHGQGPPASGNVTGSKGSGAGSKLQKMFPSKLAGEGLDALLRGKPTGGNNVNGNQGRENGSGNGSDAGAPLTFPNGQKIQGGDNTRTDEMLKLVTDNILTLQSRLVPHMFYALDYGNQPFEKVWKNDGQRIIYEKIKPLLVDLTDVMVDEETGAFLGLRNGDQELPPNKCFLFYLRGEGDDYRGTPLLENCRKIWSQWEQDADQLGRLAKKVSGVIPIVSYPKETGIDPKTGTTSVDANYKRALKIIAELSKVAGVAFEQYAFDQDDIRNVPSLANMTPWKIDLVDTGSSGGAIAPLIQKLRYYDTLMIRGYGVTERTALEGTHGTLAEAEAHANVTLINSEMLSQEIATFVNWYLVDDLLALNFGEEARGAVGITAEPLIDEKRSVLEKIFTQILANPGSFEMLMAELDVRQLYDYFKIPYLKNAVTQLQSLQKQQADDTGTGIDALLKGMGMSHNDLIELIRMDCGTGEGGFKEGNTCATGGGGGGTATKGKVKVKGKEAKTKTKAKGPTSTLKAGDSTKVKTGPLKGEPVKVVSIDGLQATIEYQTVSSSGNEVKTKQTTVPVGYLHGGEKSSDTEATQTFKKGSYVEYEGNEYEVIDQTDTHLQVLNENGDPDEVPKSKAKSLAPINKGPISSVTTALKPASDKEIAKTEKAFTKALASKGVKIDKKAVKQADNDSADWGHQLAESDPTSYNAVQSWVEDSTAVRGIDIGDFKAFEIDSEEGKERLINNHKNLIKALETAPKPAVPVFRGLTVSDAENFTKVGNTMELNAISSFSASPHVAAECATAYKKEGVILAVKQNKSGGYIGGAVNNDEKEVIVKKGTKYKVHNKERIKTRISQTGDQIYAWVYHLEEE